MKRHSTDDLVRSLARVDDDALSGAAHRPSARNLMADVMASAPSEERSARRPRRRFLSAGFGVRLAAAGTLAAVVATGAFVLRTTDEAEVEVVLPAPSAYEIRLSSAAETMRVLGRAADVAEDRSFTEPRPDQWVYMKKTMTGPAKAGGVAYGGPYRTETWELWRRVDGKQYAAYRNGEIEVGPENGTPSVTAEHEPLPDDPEALLRKISKGKYHEMAYSTLITILRDTVHSPRMEATIYRALRLVPGVRLVEGKVDADGRPALALGLTVDGWLHEEVLLDPETYAYRGERTITIADHTSVSEGEPTRTVKKGTLQFIEVRDAIAIVDEPGERS